MQKQSHGEIVLEGNEASAFASIEDRKEREENWSSTLNLRDGRWRMGAIMLIIGGILDFEALTFASQELIALLGGAATVLIGAACSFAIKRQRPTLTEIFGFAVLLVAVVCAAEGSPAEETFFTLGNLKSNFTRKRFVLYSAASVGLLLALAFVGIGSRGSHESSNRDFGKSGIAFAVMAGISGSYGVLFAKCFGEILEDLYAGNAYGVYHLTTYLFLFGLIASFALQLVLINRALMEAPYVTVLPTFQMSWILFSFCGGVFFYRDQMTDHQITFLSMSLFLSALGIFALSRGNIRHPSFEEDWTRHIRNRGLSSFSVDSDEGTENTILNVVPHVSRSRGYQRPRKAPSLERRRPDRRLDETDALI